MAFSPVSGLVPQYSEQPNYWLKFYQPGTTTPISMSLDSGGTTLFAKVQLDQDGFVTTDGTTLFIPHIDRRYDAFLFASEADADANNTVNGIRVAQNIAAVGQSGSGTVSYTEFGADPTGIIPADDAIIAAHNYANDNNLKVVQNSGVFYWQNKTASVKTCTDLTGATIRMDVNSGTTDITYSQPEMYNIDRKSASITLDASTISDLNTTFASFFEKRSTKLPESVFSQYAGSMIKIESSVLDVNRFGTNPLLKQENVTISRVGFIDQYLTFDYGGVITNVTIYPKEDFQLEFKCPKIQMDGVVSFTFVKCFRSNTKITGLVIDTDQAPLENIREIVHIIDAAHVYVSEFETYAQPNLTGQGTYTITASGVCQGVFEKLRGNSGYGFTGCNYMRNIVFRDNWINRIDCHWGAYDIDVMNNTLMDWGCLICGGGTFRAYGNTMIIGRLSSTGVGQFIIRAFFEARPDYGAEWDGDIDIQDFTFIIDAQYLVDLPDRHNFRVVQFDLTNNTADYGRAMIHGRSISVKNTKFQINGAPMQAEFEADDMHFIIVDCGDSFNSVNTQYWAHTIDVDTVTVSENPEKAAVTAYLPPRYMHPNNKGLVPARANDQENGWNTKISISNINCGMELFGDNYRSQKTGLVTFDYEWQETEPAGDFPAYRTDLTAIRPFVEITNCHAARMAIAMVGRVDVHGSTVASLQATSGSSAPFTPPKEDLLINVHNSNIRLVSSQLNSDSWEIPSQTKFFGCAFDDLMQRDGNPRVGSFRPNSTITNKTAGDRFTGTGNRQVGLNTIFNVDTPYFWTGESANPVNMELLRNPLLRVFNKNKFVHTLTGTLSFTRALARNYTDIYGNIVSGAIDVPRQTAQGWLFESNTGAGDQDIATVNSYGNLPNILNGVQSWTIVINKEKENVLPPLTYYLYRVDVATNEFRAFIDTTGEMQVDYSGLRLTVPNAHETEQIAIIWDADESILYCYTDVDFADADNTGSTSSDIGTTLFLHCNSTGGGQANLSAGEFLTFNDKLTRTDLAYLKNRV